MKKLLALVMTVILFLCTLVSCGILGFHSISYQDAATEGLLRDGYAPKWAKPGDTVVLRAGPIMDADLDFYANGVKLENTHNDSDYWEYIFIMPDEDVVITHDIVGGFGYKECVNHIDENNDSICDYCGRNVEHEHTITYIPADIAGHFENFTCGCPHDLGAVPHYDENGDYICDACGYVMDDHKHTYQTYHDEIGHGWSYTCGCMTPPNFAQHFDGDSDKECDACGYECDECNHQWDDGAEIEGGSGGYVMEYTCLLCGNKSSEIITIIPPEPPKIQTTIGEDASLPQFMSLEVDKHNALSNGDGIKVDVYMGYDILNKDGAAFSDIIVPESDFAKYSFVLEINYNNETRTVALDAVNYFEEYRCDMYQGVVQYSKYNTVQFDTTKMTGKSYGFANVELYMISDTNERYIVSAETLYYSVTDTEIVFGLVSNPVANEGDPGIITNGWEYSGN